MRLTPADINELRRIVSDHVNALMLQAFGPEALGLTAEDVARLVKDGLLDAASVAAVDPVGNAYWLGRLGEQMKAKGLAPETATVAEIAAVVKAATPAVTYPAEVAAIAFAKQTAGIYAKGLGNRMADQIVSAANAEDQALRAKMVTTIQTETARAIENRLTVSNLASNLGHATNDWARDWRRIAATELQNAHQHGLATAIAHDFGPDALVAKVPTDGACPKCRSLYLENGRPKIFKLSDLMANGTNIGRKSKEWLPTIGAIHPWCKCTLVGGILPLWWFDESWSLRPPKKVAAS